MSETTNMLGEYANEHCGGDRFYAIFELMKNSGKGGFDPYVDELSEEEAGFVASLLTLESTRIFGKDGFRKMVKTGQLAASLGTTTEEVSSGKRNPYTKGLLFGILSILGAIALSVLLSVGGIAGFETFSSVLIGLGAINLSSKILPFLRYNRLKRMVVQITKIEASAPVSSEPITFEEAMTLHLQTAPDAPIEKEEAEVLLRAAKKRNIKALLWMPAYLLVIILCSVLASETGIIGAILGVLVVVAFFAWQEVSTFKSALKTKAIANIHDVDAHTKHAMDTRQSLLVLAMLCIAGIYLILAVVGCLLCTVPPSGG